MPASLKISADTSDVKKSLLDLSRSVKNIGSSKVSIFSESDKRFMKGELKKEMNLMKTRLKENRDEIKKMVLDQKSMVRGSREELEVRKKILDAYKTQSKLGKELEEMKVTSFGGGAGMGGLLSKGLGMTGIAALAIGGLAVAKGIQASNQFVGGVGNRVRLRGLGVNQENFGNPEEMAKAGLTEQDLIQRQIEATAVLGRQGTNTQNELQKAMFERAYGLQGGTMTNISTQLRAGFGGQGANQAQMKLQAAIIASGLEDALKPYLDTMTHLLSSINEFGMTNTDEITNIMAKLTKQGQRTPEQMDKEFQTVNSSLKNSTGEKNAFLQEAFARMGIGGGTIGGTKFALESGGLFGLNEAALAKRGYNPKLLKQMEGQGYFTGVGGRSTALLNMFKAQSGMKRGQSISGVTNPLVMIGLTNMANQMFGTKGMEGFDTLKLLEQVQGGKISSNAFNNQLKKMQQNPQLSRLDQINKTLDGQTQILSDIDTNLTENYGKQTVLARNQAKIAENAMTRSATSLAKTVIPGTARGIGTITKTLDWLSKGGLGEKLYDEGPLRPKSNFGLGDLGMTPPNPDSLAKKIGSEVGKAMKKSPIHNHIQIKNNTLMIGPSEKTYK